MNRRPKLITTSAAVAAVALAGAIGVTAAANADDEPPTETIKPATTDDEGDGDDGADDRDGAEESEVPITEPDLERAKEAALAHVGAGKVTETEIEDEESYYEVEVRLPDGRQVDVQLNKSFNVVYVDGD